MATYVLVHGAWGSGRAFEAIAGTLRAAGHSVHIAALTGLGERVHQLSPAITLSTHIADVVGLFDTYSLDHVILVGHSYGGMVITGVAAQKATRIRALVYIDAFLPRDGQSLWDIADEPSRRHYIDAQRDMPGLVAPFPGSPPTLTRHPLLTLVEPLHSGGDENFVARRSYVYATRGAPTVFTKFYDRVKNDRSWDVRAVDSGHSVMHDAPEALLDCLLDAAR
jgi:pimeloyl-ACP methyl ester carboxylesterase